MPEVKLEMLMASTVTTTTSSAEELLEYFICVKVELLSTTREAATASRVLASCLSFHTFLAMLIIHLPLFRVRKCFIGIGNFLELLLRPFWIILVLVGMILDGHLLERLLYLVICGSTLHAQDLVVVLSQGCQCQKGQGDQD